MFIIYRYVANCEEFLSLSYEEVIKLISCNDLFVPNEEKVSKLRSLVVVF